MDKISMDHTNAFATECVIACPSIPIARSFLYFRTLTSALALTLFCGASAALTGCSTVNAHQIISPEQACISCHSDEKTTYDVSAPKGAIESGIHIVVKTSADKVVVCEPTFVSGDGSKFVPVMSSMITTTNGQADITLDEGMWVLGIEEDGSSKTQVVYVSSQIGSSDATIIEL